MWANDDDEVCQCRQCRRTASEPVGSPTPEHEPAADEYQRDGRRRQQDHFVGEKLHAANGAAIVSK
jgi:hypothetical protein